MKHDDGNRSNGSKTVKPFELAFRRNDRRIRAEKSERSLDGSKEYALFGARTVTHCQTSNSAGGAGDFSISTLLIPSALAGTRKNGTTLGAVQFETQIALAPNSR